MVHKGTASYTVKRDSLILPGDYDLPKYFSQLKNQRVGLVIHPCSSIEGVLLLDTLIRLGINIKKVFSPEHGFRGDADNGSEIPDQIDPSTKLPIYSLYGKSKRPDAASLADLDVVVFDLQDVGVRFYTYLSTLTYIMEACARFNKKLIVLDRPNPNGFYVDGPVLDTCCHSFIGMHKIPVVHGMTLGELAQMIKGEGWIENAASLSMRVIPCINYTHQSRYVLPVKPSPNLPDARSILLYPSLCFFEGTIVSLGRGTDAPFQIYGHPDFRGGDTSFTPMPRTGSMEPPLSGKKCVGFSLKHIPLDDIYSKKEIDLNYLISAYQIIGKRQDFFLPNRFFDLLAGNRLLRSQIISGMSKEDIRQSWDKDLTEFWELRKKYLIYK